MTTDKTNAATGPKTPAGKAVSARNATTHGLFCRQTVLPHLGEDPAGFQRLLDTLHEQLRPRNLMETQYLELWADASWKLRRLSRLEAQVWEDSLDEDARLAKLERLIRLQTSLRRQLDRAVRMLSQDVPNLFAHRTREDILAKLQLTETQCAQNPYREQDVERAIQANRHWPAPADDFTDGLDNTPPADADTKNCQNEPAPVHPSFPGEEGEVTVGARSPRPTEAPRPTEPEEVLHAFCQNEPAPVPSPHPLPQGEVSGLAHSEGSPNPPAYPNNRDAGGPCDRGTREQGGGPPLSRRAERRRELQELEDLVNSGSLTNDECRTLLMSENIPGFSLGDGRIEIHKGGRHIHA